MSQNSSRTHTAREVQRWIGGQAQAPILDAIIVEQPLAIHVEGQPFLSTMRTPGDDLDLSMGLLLHEGVISDRDDITSMRAFSEDGRHWTDCRLAPGLMPPDPSRRRAISSACGLCGAGQIERRLRQSAVPPSASRVSIQRLHQVARSLKEHQPLFSLTGGAHGAVLLDQDGERLCLREDVGRHNAVDKVIGWALRADIEHADTLLVSSRISYEIVEKAMVFGLGQVGGLSAPTSMAIDLAKASGIRLVAFLGSNRPTRYAGKRAPINLSNRLNSQKS